MGVNHHGIAYLPFDGVLAETVVQRSLEVPAIADVDREVCVDVGNGFYGIVVEVVETRRIPLCFVTGLKADYTRHLPSFFRYVAKTLDGEVEVESVVPQLCFASAGSGMCLCVGTTGQTMHVNEHADSM